MDAQTRKLEENSTAGSVDTGSLNSNGRIYKISRDMEDKIQLFYHAVLDHDIDLMEELVTDHDIDVNQIFKGSYVQPWHNGSAAVHVLAHSHKEKINALEKIVQLGAKIDLRNKSGDTALHIACKYGNYKSVTRLLRQDPSCKDIKNNQGITPLLKAIFHIQSAFKSKYIKIVEALIKAGCDVNASPKISGITPLHVAAEKWYPGITQMLVKAGANVNAICSTGMSPLLTAICGKGIGLNKMINQEIVKLLVEAGADPNITMPSGRSPLHMAVSKSDDKIVQHLLSAGSDPNLMDNYGVTPMYLAVQDNNITILPILVSYGGNVNFLPIMQDKTLLELSVSCQHVEMVKLLLKFGAKIENGFNVSDRNILSSAVGTQNLSIVKIFLSENCPVDEPRYGNFNSPIQTALENGNTEIIKLLVEAGAVMESDSLNHFNMICDDEEFKYWLEFKSCNPRTLLQLSRAKIRQILGLEIKSKIQTVITEHLLPGSLVNYLMLGDILTV